MVRDQSTSARWEDLIRPRDLWQLIWSTEGWRCIFYKRGEQRRHEFFKSNEEAEAFVLRVDQWEDFHVYHACGTTQDNTSRKQANIWHLKCYWLDLDCGSDKPYGDVAEARGELQRFCRELSLPDPILVGSGHGLHCYWILEKPVAPQEWQPGAEALKRACEHLGLHAGPERTADCASILRPPGTRNKKTPEAPLVVGAGACEPIALDAFRERVGAGSDQRDRPQGHHGNATDQLNRDTAAVYAHVPTSAAKIADACAQMALMRDSKGNVPEPLWYSCICVLGHCDDGHELAHAWSSGYPNYTPAETATKFEHAKADSPGPTTCARFQKP
jgi:hypothetical protein